MKPPATLARLEMSLIETQYALADFMYEIENQPRPVEKDALDISNRVVRISLSMLDLLKTISDARSEKSREEIFSSENARQGQDTRAASSN
jgi:hypothetical protein